MSETTTEATEEIAKLAGELIELVSVRSKELGRLLLENDDVDEASFVLRYSKSLNSRLKEIINPPRWKREAKERDAITA